jgi:hypothetical protein
MSRHWFNIATWYDRVDLIDEMYYNNTLLGYNFASWNEAAQEADALNLRYVLFTSQCVDIAYRFWGNLLRGKFRIPIFLIKHKILDFDYAQSTFPHLAYRKTFKPVQLHRQLIAARVAAELEIT